MVSLPAITGCAAVRPAAEPVAVSDALRPSPALTVASAEGFVVGDALGMALYEGFGVRLADVNEPFEFTD